MRVKVRARGVEEDEVDRRVSRWRSELDGMGCGSELSNVRTLFSVDVPPGVDYGPVRDFLDEGTGSGEIGFEEANLRHQSPHERLGHRSDVLAESSRVQGGGRSVRSAVHTWGT